MDTTKNRTESVLPCSFSVSFAHQSVAIVMGLVRLSQPAYERYGGSARSSMHTKACAGRR